MTQGTVILLLLTFICFLLNLDAPKLVSEAPFFQLFLDFLLLLFCSKILVNKVLRQYSQSIRVAFWNYFLLSLSISLFFLWYMWTPLLNPSLPDWGFDPLKYYYSATEIMRTGFTVFNMSYVGVVYYNVAIMQMFGMDPLVPLFTNSLLTFYAVLSLTKYIDDENNIKKYAMLLLIPEIISYNMMASREIICASMVTVFVVKFQELKIRINIPRVLVLISSFLLVALVRPPMAGLAILGVFLYMIFIQKSGSVKSFLFIGIAIIIMGVGLAMSSSLGSVFTTESISESVSSSFAGDNEERDDAKPGLTTMLIPHNPVEYVVFGFIRSFAYVIPGPAMLTDFSNQFSLKHYEVFENLTTLMMFVLFPFILRSLKRRRCLDNNMKFVVMLLLCYFFAIGISLPNLIQNRYRIVYDLFYFTIAIYGWTHKNDWKNKKILS